MQKSLESQQNIISTKVADIIIFVFQSHYSGRKDVTSIAQMTVNVSFQASDRLTKWNRGGDLS